MENNMADDVKTGLLGLNDYQKSGLSNFAAAFAQMAGGYMNYRALRMNASELKLQANNIELQAQERANQLREQFISAVGSYQMGAAQRGVSVGSGSVRNNIESSAMSLGSDISTMKKSAQLQAKALRTQAKVSKLQAKSAVVSGTLKGIGSIGKGIENMYIGSTIGG